MLGIQAKEMEEQKDILQDYLTSKYKNMWETTVEASGGVYLPEEEKEELSKDYKDIFGSERVRDLNKAILSVSHNDTSPLTVYRYAERGDNRMFAVGTTVLMDRFMSTSSSSDIGDQKKSLIRIELPKGFPALVIRTRETIHSSTEREVLLPFTLDVTGNSLNYGILFQLTLQELPS
jgi:hypothetical protein